MTTSHKSSMARRYLVASDFDQTLSFNDSGVVLSELLGTEGFPEKVAGLSRANFVQQGAELSYLLLHDPEYRQVRREHLIEVGKQIRLKRNIDVLTRMQSNSKIDMQMHDGKLPELREVQKVDERLVTLAKAVGGRVVTNDFNLNKVAQLQGVDVINLNELANALKSVALPGEMMNVRLVKAGDQIGQGVGYLEDGTMVVVEQGRSAIGQEVTITVTSVLQTPAGRMIFGRIESRPVPAGAAGGAATTTGPSAEART